MKTTKPAALLKLRHVSLYVQNITRSLHFYQDLLGMKTHWQPDDDNVYLTNGDDIIALHHVVGVAPSRNDHTSFDHLGFFLHGVLHVVDWRAYLQGNGVEVSELELHRDGSYGFYCYDPDGNSVEIISCPNLSA